VKLVLKPTTKARSINAVSAKFTYNPAEFQLQQSNAKAPKTDDITFLVAADGNTTVSATTATVSGVASITAFVSKTGQGPLTLVSGTEYDVATFWVRPLKKGSLTITLDTANIVTAVGEKTAATPPVIAFAVTTTAINGTIAPVFGTIGVTLKTRSPFAHHPDLDYGSTDWATGTFTVVDGRYLDVAIWVDAASDDQKQASTYIVDLDFDTTQLTFRTPTAWANSTGNYILGAVDPQSATVTVNGGQLNISLQKASSTLDLPEEIIRLRFEVNPNAVTPTNQVKLKVADTTVLRQLSGLVPDANDIYANVRGSVNTPPNYTSTPPVANVNTQLGEFDSAPVITRQYPASLQMRPRLQGRTVTSPDERFNQAVVVKLIDPVTHVPVARHKTVDVPEAVKWSPSSYFNDMQYDWWLSAKYAQGSPIKPVAVLSKLTDSTYAEDDISDLEPGTYDVFLKGPSSVGILVKGVPFGPGDAKKIDGIILREGDINHDEKVDGTDFSLFSPAYNTAGTVTMGAGTGSADFNQSGYVDMLDYSLLASNFNTNTAGPDEPPVGDALGNVRVARVNTSSAYTLPAIALTQATTTYAVGDVVPVTVTLNPGSRTVDGVQIVVRAGNGAELVGTNAFVKATSSPLSLIFSNAVNAGRDMIELALGRSPSATVSGPTVLGTVNVRITGDVTGDLLTVDANGNGQFETMIAGGGDNLLDPSTYYVAPVPAPAVSGGSNSSSGGNGSAAAAPARASAPSRAAAPAPAASAPVPAPMSPALSEDTARGIVSVAIPG
ncbi:MAG: hypothetical protein EBT09_08630, partial [Actinobacteria bacterium]|nr:hypothetical protein [Actinomycetota bacterium]